MLTSKLGKSINYIPRRFVRKPTYFKSWPNDWVPFHWSRPETIPGYKLSGDLEKIRQPTREESHPKYKNSDRLNKLPDGDPIKRMFSLDHASKRDMSRTYRSELIKERGLIHDLDFSNSFEAKIISLTISLRGCYAEIDRIGPDDQRSSRYRLAANSFLYRRHKYLCALKKIHSERWKAILERLKIEPRDNPINVPFYEPFRKLQMRKLAIEYASALKEKKVEQFIQSLETEKEKFKKEKEETLKWIEAQERALSG